MLKTKWIMRVTAVLALVVGGSLTTQAQTSVGKFAWNFGDVSGNKFCDELVLEVTEAKGFFKVTGFDDFGPCGQPQRKLPVYGTAFFLPDGKIRLAITLHSFFPELPTPVYGVSEFAADLSPTTFSGTVRGTSGAFVGTLTFIGQKP